MENDSRFGRLKSNVGDKLAEQVWFQQLKAKWEELDPQSRLYLKAAGGGGSALLVLIVLISSIWSVHKLKIQFAEKTDLLAQIQSANDELRRLRDSTPAAGASAQKEQGAWSAFFEMTAAGAGIEKAALSVSTEQPGATSDQAKESLFDLSLKHVTIKQAVRFAFQIENGVRPVKLRNLLIDTKSDPSGYMDATLSVSAFALKAQ